MLCAHKLRHRDNTSPCRTGQQTRQRNVTPSYWVYGWTDMRVPSRREKCKHRPVPSKTKKQVPTCPVVKIHAMVGTVSSRREKNCAPSRPVERKKSTVPSRRDEFYLPCRPVIRNRSSHCTVPSSREISHPPSRPVPSTQL